MSSRTKREADKARRLAIASANVGFIALPPMPNPNPPKPKPPEKPNELSNNSK